MAFVSSLDKEISIILLFDFRLCRSRFIFSHFVLLFSFSSFDNYIISFHRHCEELLRRSNPPHEKATITVQVPCKRLGCSRCSLAMTGLKYIMPHVVLNRAHAASSPISTATSLPRHCEESAGRRGNLIHEKAATTLPPLTRTSFYVSNYKNITNNPPL